MSNKYSWSAMDGGTIHCSTNSGDEYLLGHEIAVRINKMQDIVNAAKHLIEVLPAYTDVERVAASNNLANAIASLNPLTEQELNDEVLRAAITWNIKPNPSNGQALKQASAAWLKFKNSSVASKQS